MLARIAASLTRQKEAGAAIRLLSISPDFRLLSHMVIYWWLNNGHAKRKLRDHNIMIFRREVCSIVSFNQSLRGRS